MKKINDIHGWKLSGLFALVFILYVGVCEAATRYVSLAGGHVPPFTSWTSAATNIQAALDICAAGDTVLVTNGVYDSGYRILESSNSSTTHYSRCRIMVTNQITVRSVNGPDATVIVGQGPRGESAVRCAYLVNGARLSGFTLREGQTYAYGPAASQQGGGAYCSSSVVISNCVVTENVATYGGGIYGGTVVNSMIANNTATGLDGTYWRDRENRGYGGGVYGSEVRGSVISGNRCDHTGAGAFNATLTLCRLTDNYGALKGAGASDSDLKNCLVARNRAIGILRDTYQGAPRGVLFGTGGGAWHCNLWNCTVIDNDAAETCGGVYRCQAWNSIVYWNRAPEYPNYNGDAGRFSSRFTNCCVTPIPPGVGNTASAPALLSLEEGRFAGSSPAFDSGCGDFVKTSVDLDNVARTNNGAVDMGAFEYYAPCPTGQPIQVAMAVDFPWAPTGFVQHFESRIKGPVAGYTWDMGDGTIVSNQVLVDHAYAAPGSYDVVLSAEAGGFTLTATTRVEVSAIISAPGSNGTTRFVSLSGGHVPPFASWADAATNIQAAIDVSAPGNLVLVTNGLYRTGKRVVHGMPTRVAVTRPITVRSVNGPDVTAIEGGNRWDSDPVRCAYLFYHARLDGFTLTNGCTWAHGDALRQQSGGGAFCETDAVLEDCALVANHAYVQGGGVYGGALRDCRLRGNGCARATGTPSGNAGAFSSTGRGGGACRSDLLGCEIRGNGAALEGGGLFECVAVDCILDGNRAISSDGRSVGGAYAYTRGKGGAAYASTLTRCELTANEAGEYGGATYNCTLTSCQLTGNRVDGGYHGMSGSYDYGSGGAIYGGFARLCMIENNETKKYGGGTCDAVLENCLLSGNRVAGESSSYYDPGAIFGAGGGACRGSLVNCTIVDNEAQLQGGGAYAANLINCIVCYNASPSGPEMLSCSSSNCCFSDPGLAGRYNLRLLLGSPCINAGDNSPVTWSKDLAGNPRIAEGQVDIGAYEFSLLGAFGTLNAIVEVANAVDVLKGCPIEFEAIVEGVPLGYLWDWDDGAFDLNTYNPTHAFASGGTYRVVFYAWNATHVASFPVVITVVDVDDLYVSPSGGHVYPFDTWERAATNIQAAADICGSGMTIFLTNGHYRLDASVEVRAGCTLESVNGAEVTIVDGQDAVRCFHLTHSNAVLRGLSITGGRADHGAGVLAEGGLIEDCLIYANEATNSSFSWSCSGPFFAGYGGGVAIERGVVRDCLIHNNQAGDGAGVYAAAGACVETCLIISNTSHTPWYEAAGGGVYCDNSILKHCEVRDNASYLEGGGVYCVATSLVENCIIAGNYAWMTGGGAQGSQNSTVRNCVIFSNKASMAAGSYLENSTMEHCTVVGNRSSSTGAGLELYRSNVVRNCIVVMNENAGDPPVLNVRHVGNSASSISYSLVQPLQDGIGNIAEVPLFVNATNGDYRLLAGSPGIDAGVNLPEIMADCEGTPRPLDGNGDGVARADMGAYEYVHTHYLAKEGSHEWPFATWATAATNMVDVVDSAADGKAILISNGVYALDSHLNISKAITLSGASGPEQSTLQGSWITLNHSNATLSSLRVADGWGITLEKGLLENCIIENCMGIGGGGLSIFGGTASNCIVRNNEAIDYGWTLGHGGGVLLDGGLLTHSLIESNKAYYGGGIYMYDGTVRHCRVAHNNGTSGGGIDHIGGLVEDCLIERNRGLGVDVRDEESVMRRCRITANSGGGVRALRQGLVENCLINANTGSVGGVICSGGHVVNVTVVDNVSPTGVGGIWGSNNGKILNCIAAFNWSSATGTESNFARIFTPATAYVASLCTDDPMFVDRAGGDYRLLPGSPCIDAGENRISDCYGSAEAPPEDYARRIRPVDGIGDGMAYVDIGAFERMGFSYADAARPDDSSDGLSWATAKQTIQAAVDIVDVGGRVWVTNGVYDNGECRTPGGRWTNRVCITRAMTVASVNGPAVTIIDGQDAVRGVFMTNGCSLAGFSVTNGRALYEASDHYLDWKECEGGGVWMADDCIVSNCILSGNSAPMSDGGGARGGALIDCVLSGNAAGFLGGGAAYSRLVNCSLTHNWASSCGGGAYLSTLYDCHIAQNSASNGAGAYGGVLNNCVVLANHASLSGGGAFEAVLNHCTLTENTAGHSGGGAKNSELTDCIISYNDSGYLAGGAYGCDLNNCSLIGNTAHNFGGGAGYSTLKECELLRNRTTSFLSGGSGGGTYRCVLESCLLSRNIAPYGGGASDGELYGCTIADNQGGGCHYSKNYNCIIWGNSDYDVWGGHTEYSCASDGIMAGVNGCITNNPLFLNAANGDYHLQAGSPCIDTANPSNSLSIDLDGVPRPLDGNGDGVAISDMGAYEFLLPTADSDGDGIPDGEEWAVYGTSLVSGDTDGDGQLDSDEVIARTNPHDPDDFFGLYTLQPPDESGNFVLRWMSSTNCLYCVYQTDDLTGEWAIIPGGEKLPGTGGWMEFTAHTHDDAGPFYRIMTYPKP